MGGFSLVVINEKRFLPQLRRSAPLRSCWLVNREHPTKCRRHEIKFYSNFDSHESFFKKYLQRNTTNEKRFFFQPRRGLIFVERIFEKDKSAVGTRLNSIQFLILMSLFLRHQQRKTTNEKRFFFQPRRGLIFVERE
jgi:hypothetical protein